MDGDAEDVTALFNATSRLASTQPRVETTTTTTNGDGRVDGNIAGMRDVDGAERVEVDVGAHETMTGGLDATRRGHVDAWLEQSLRMRPSTSWEGAHEASFVSSPSPRATQKTATTPFSQGGHKGLMPQKYRKDSMSGLDGFSVDIESDSFQQREEDGFFASSGGDIVDRPHQYVDDAEMGAKNEKSGVSKAKTRTTKKK